MRANYAEIWRKVAQELPDRIAIVAGPATFTYAEYDRLASKLASLYLDRGLKRGSKIAILMYNRAEYLVALYAAFKIGAAPVTLNYRYRATEVSDLLKDCGADALVYPASLTSTVVGVAQLMALPPLVIMVEDGDEPSGEQTPDGVVHFNDLVDYEEFSEESLGADDELLLYTGGTTGRPKAVVWTLEELLDVQTFSIFGVLDLPVPTTVDEAVELVASGQVPSTVVLPLAPFMHGTALFNAMNTFVLGGTLVVLPTPKYDPHQAVKVMLEERVTRLIVAGDAVVLPLLDEMDAENLPALPDLQLVISSGMRLSDDAKLRIHALGDITVSDFLASTEGGPYAISSTRAGTDLPSQFRLTTGAVVLDESMREVQDEIGAVGVLGYRGTLPKGYFNDPEKTRATYPELGGIRHVIPGDLVRVQGDGVIELLGRGSSVVNSGGEKVYPAEVEEALMSHFAVNDAVVFGIADSRWGELVAAVVATEDPQMVSEQELVSHVGTILAGYKKPKSILILPSLERSPSGKVDIPAMKKRMAERP